MEWSDVFKIATAAVASIGTASVIIGGLAKFLGGIWAERFLENVKQKNRVELESMRCHLEKEVEGMRAELQAFHEQKNMRFSFYSRAQFELYSDLWASLIDLSDGVEALWVSATSSNLRKFIRDLSSVKRNIKKTAIILEPQHYTQMVNLISHFEEYQIGKGNLIQARNINTYYEENEINELIRDNNGSKNRIKTLIDEILESMRRQINGQGNVAPEA